VGRVAARLKTGSKGNFTRWSRRAAFTIGLPDYDSERKRHETLGLNVETKEHKWNKWRSLYFHDPEGNQVESFGDG
jgi:hypothetical protein